MLKHLFIPHPSKKERKAEMLLTFSQWMLFWSVPFVRFNPHLCLLHLSALFPPLNEREREREGGSAFKKIHLLIPFAGHSRWNHIASASFFLSSVNSFKILPSLWKSSKALSSFCFFFIFFSPALKLLGYPYFSFKEAEALNTAANHSSSRRD